MSQERRAVIVVAAIVFPALAAAQPAPSIAEVRSILREAGALIPKLEGVQKLGAAANIASQQVRAGDLAGALTTVEQLDNDQQRALAFDRAAYSLTFTGNWRIALQIADQLPDRAGRNWVYGTVGSALAANGDFENALFVAQGIEAKENDTYLDTLVHICVQQWKAGRNTDALNTLDEITRTVESRRANSGQPGLALARWYTELTQLLVTVAGNRNAAAVVVGLLNARTMQERDPVVKCSLVSQLALGQAMVGNFTVAVHFAEQLEPTEERASLLYSIAAEEARQGDTAGARSLAEKIPANWRKASSVEELAYALAASGDTPGAMAAIEAIQQPGEHAYALAQLALQQAGRSDPAAGSTILRARDAAEAAGKDTPGFVWEAISVARGHLGDFDGALAIINRSQDSARVFPLWGVTSLMVLAGKKDEALAVAHAQDAPYPRAYALLGTASTLVGEIELQARKGEVILQGAGIN